MGRQDAFVLDDKGRVLLGKLRKGADASLSLPQLFKVLRFLGNWRIEEIVGLVPLHYDKTQMPYPKYSLWVEDEQKARDTYERLKSLQVRSLPTHPKLGQLFVMDLEPFKSFPQAWRKAWGTQYNVWAALAGYRITDPQGQTFEVLPNRHAVTGSQSPREREADIPTFDPRALLKREGPGDLLRWLKEKTPYLDQINAALGTEHHKPGAVRTRQNTGTCGACFKNIKLEHLGGDRLPVTALHGYQRPGTGHIEGRCAGENMPPYELSPKATDKRLHGFMEAMKGVRHYIGNLKTGRVTEIIPYIGATVIRQSDLPAVVWEREVRNEIKRQERECEDLEAAIEVFGWLVKNWKKRDLPKEGEIEFDWPGHAARQLRATGRT
jgi:hypothetical protein